MINFDWYVYVLITIPIFTVCLLVHFIVKKVNEARYGQRLIRLYGKTSASTQVQSPLLEIESKKLLSRPKDSKRNSRTSHEGISLIFSKEENRRKKSLRVSTTFMGTTGLVIPNDIKERSATSSRVLSSICNFPKLGSKLNSCAAKEVSTYTGDDVYNMVKVPNIENKINGYITNETIPYKTDKEDKYNKFLGTIYCKVKVESDDTIKEPYVKAVATVDSTSIVEESLASASHCKSDNLITKHSQTIVNTEIQTHENKSSQIKLHDMNVNKPDLNDNNENIVENISARNKTNSILKLVVSKETTISPSRVTFAEETEIEPEKIKVQTEAEEDTKVKNDMKDGEDDKKKTEPVSALDGPSSAEDSKSFVKRTNFVKDNPGKIQVTLLEQSDSKCGLMALTAGENLRSLLEQLTYCEDCAAVKFIPSKDDYEASIIKCPKHCKPRPSCTEPKEKTANLGVDKSLECTIEPSSIDIDIDDISLGTNETNITEEGKEDSQEKPKDQSF